MYLLIISEISLPILHTCIYMIRLWHMRLRAIANARLCTGLKHYRRAKKSIPCLIKKAPRCAADCMSKTTFFIFHFL